MPTLLVLSSRIQETLWQWVSGFPLHYLLSGYNISDFMLRYLNHLYLNFVQYDKYESISILLHADIQFYYHYLLKVFSVCLFMSESSCLIPLSSMLLSCKYHFNNNSAILENINGKISSSVFVGGYSFALC